MTITESYQSALAFVTSALMALVLRSHDCFVVDGSNRCLPVYRLGKLFFHPNNHFLYPANVLAWTRMASALGFDLSDPLRFFVAVATMNCLAAAGVLAILYWILLRVTSSWKLATTVCMGYGLTRAFLPQAINPNEPMVAIFWSFLAVLFAIVSLGKHKLWPLVVSGILFALAIATYRTTVLLAPAAAVIVVSDVAFAKSSFLKQVPRLAVLGIAFLSGCVAIYGWAYSRMGMPRAVLSSFFQEADTRVYFDPSPYQILKLPLGLTRNVFPVVRFYNGMHGFLTGPKSVLVPAVLLIVALGFCLLCCGYVLVKHWASLNAVERTAVIASLTGLFFALIPLLTWNPDYGKFWIQPLACLAILLAVAFRLFSLESRQTFLLARAAGFLLLLGVTFNLTWAVGNHLHQPFEFEEAHKVTQFVSGKDFVLLDRGSDRVSVIYAALWADPAHVLPFIDTATVRGRDAIRDVDAAIQLTQSTGGKVFFLGLVDLPKATWDVILGKRCGVPYEDFERFRSAVHPVAKFQNLSGWTYLYELDATSAHAKQAQSPAQSPES